MSNAPFPFPYKEMTLLIPFVQKKGESNWHNYALRMYLDNAQAVFLGNTFYGYARKLGNFVEDTNNLVVSALAGDVVRINAVAVDDWLNHEDADESLPYYRSMLEILQMPVLGRHRDGHNICSYFELNPDDALVRKLAAHVEFLSPLVPAMESWAELGRQASAPDGAFEIRALEWRIQYPPAACQF